ncbi:class I SAM-dependent methyltransferase [Thermococcus sp. MV5]|uniref:class I SAM-dependent methyltransferase n=1 Tax=Thermococcus sp. MV5 TaxID=1638272 RepID=UPI00143A6871|nr:class I SAM-dependent methyltransferase [Thermococcus sp. MV5]
MRDYEEIILRWTKQPPTIPIVQYLRDEEKRRALELIEDSRIVLDIGSEIKVTLTLNILASKVIRVDFSKKASEIAKDTIQKKQAHNAVFEFYHIDVRNPKLPYPSTYFDAAISIGPYDWKFLDVHKLTSEIYRVLKPGGKFVFSVPTKLSPYKRKESERIFRYYSLDELFDLISIENWKDVRFSLIYQPPRKAYIFLSLLPQLFQKPFIDLFKYLSRRLTESQNLSKASYIVTCLQK